MPPQNTKTIPTAKDFIDAVNNLGFPELATARLAPESQKISPMSNNTNDKIPDSVVEWLADGKRGPVSNALCKRLYGLPKNAGKDHPRHFSELLQCIEFLEQTQSFQKLSLMSDVSPYWAKVVENWDVIGKIYTNEGVSKVNAFLKDIELEAAGSGHRQFGER